MTNAEKIIELQDQIAKIKADLENAHPDRLSQDDIECVSDNYQAHLEYGWYYDEQMDIISGIKADIVALQALPAIGTWIGDICDIEEIVWPPASGKVPEDCTEYAPTPEDYWDGDNSYNE